MAGKFQTLPEFLKHPFGNQNLYMRNTEYDKRYTQFMRSNKIHFDSYCQIEDSYYLHFTVPSESHSGNYVYDVILRFFPDSEEVKKELNLINYKVQFFSNSPGFIFRYAALYKQHGYLIEQLYDKMDPDYMDKMPDKTNASHEMSYDSSIYYVCRYLREHHFRYLSKFGVMVQRKRTPSRFFADITSFRDVKLDADLMREEKKSKRELEETSKSKPKTGKDIKSDENPRGAIRAKKSGNGKVSKIKASSSVGTDPKIIRRPTMKVKKPKKSTTRHTRRCILEDD